MARPDKYKTNVEPYLEDIKQMCLTMSEAQIAETLGVSISAFKRYKARSERLRASLKKGRQDLVMELRSSLIRRAKGFQYEERKTIKESGQPVREEIYIRTALPDVAALNLLLKNYDKENWANDPQALRIREKELELQEKRIEAGEWQ